MSDIIPGHAVRLTVNGRDVRIRDTFDLALRLEERFGSLFELILRPRANVPLRDLLGIYEEALAPHSIDAAAIHVHISEIGVGGAWREIGKLLTVIAEGWSALSEEATAAAEGNPPPRPNGQSEASRGPTFSELQAFSELAPANSGGERLSNSPPSGGLMPDDLAGIDPVAVAK